MYYLSPQTIWLDFDGNVVAHDSPSATHCAAQEGMILTEEEAKKYEELTGEMPPAYEEDIPPGQIIGGPLPPLPDTTQPVDTPPEPVVEDAEEAPTQPQEKAASTKKVQEPA